MIDQSRLVEWQKIDPKSQLVFPWFTHPMLDILSEIDFSEKTVLEFGGGRSTAWWRDRAKWVTTVETNREWAQTIVEECQDHGLHNGRIYYAQLNEGDSHNAKRYVEAGKSLGPYDVVIVDGILRYECLEYALTLPRPLLLIADNWQQDYVWISPKAEELMKPYPITVCVQENHTNNEGNKWKTVFWELK